MAQPVIVASRWQTVYRRSGSEWGQWARSRHGFLCVLHPDVARSGQGINVILNWIATRKAI